VADERDEVDDAGDEVDHAEAGDGAAREVVLQQRRDGGPVEDEVVAAPEVRPGKNDEEQAGFEKEGDVDQPTNQGLTPSSLSRAA
jgi:hypothetical protein